MNKQNLLAFWKACWPHLVAICVFLILVITYFAPQVFNDKQLPQGDIISARGMGMDAREYHETTGEWSYWSNSMFSGMPYNVTSGVDSKSVFRPLSNIAKCGLHGDTTSVLWLLLIGFYIFMLCAGCSPWLSLVGAVAFAFASYNLIIIDAGHITKGWVMATMPAVIGGCVLCFRRKYVAGFIVTLLATGLNVYWNHQQISYYTVLMLLPMAINYLIFAIKEKEVKSFSFAALILVIAAIMAVVPALDKLVPTWDYSKETMRGGAVLETKSDVEAEKSGLDRDYAFSWSYGIGETMTLLIPNIYGASSNYPLGEDSQMYKLIKKNAGASTAKQFVKSAPTYWGDQPFTSGPVYAGAIICFLFILGLLVVPHKERWWLLAIVIIGVVLSWGRHFPWLNNWLFDHLPLYNKFRTPSMALVMTTTAMAMAALLAFKEVIERKVSLRSVLIAGGITSFICMLYAIFPSIAGDFTGRVDSQMPNWLLPALIDDRRHLLTADAWRSFVYIVLAAVVIATYLKFDKLRSGIAIAIVGVLIIADLWTVDKRFLNDSHFVPKKQALVAPSQADKQILQDTDPDYRVLNLASNTFNESRTSYYHKSVGGYSPAKLRRYQDIIDYYLSGRLNPNVLNMLNTRYVITQQGVQRNPEAFGNAWFVHTLDWVNTPNEEIDAIGSADLRTKAIMDTCWRKSVKAFEAMQTPAKIELVNYANPGNLFYESESEEDGLAVFSEVYYKTWKAYIDGEQVPVLRANYILRAIEIPAGQHTIEFRCVDDLLIKMQKVSIISSIMVVLAILLALAIAIKKDKLYARFGRK